jgi:hypothetical protein
LRLFPGKQQILSFDGGDISSDGGLLLLAKIDRKMGLTSNVARTLRDRRQRHLVKHGMKDLLLQRILSIAAGYEDAIDAGALKNDPVFKLSLGRKPDDGQSLASQPTISRLENSVGPKSLYRMAAGLVEFYVSRHAKAPKQITLDFDGTYIETHGNQQLSMLRSYYNKRMYFPLMVYDQDGRLITALLRPGSYGDVRLALPVLKRLVRRFRKAWPHVQILFRGDAAFHCPRIFDWCEDHEVQYIVGFPSNHGLNVCAAQFVSKAGSEYGRRFGSATYCSSKQKLLAERTIMALPKDERYAALRTQRDRRVRVIGDFYYQAGMGKKQWRCERRFIAVCDMTDEGLRRRYVVTNLKGPAQYVYERIYCQRARAELCIGQFKALNCTRLSCCEFYANQFRLFLHAMAYMLLYEMRSQLGKSARKQTMTSLQRTWIKIAVQVKESARAIWLRYSSSFAKQREFWALCKRLDALPS